MIGVSIIRKAYSPRSFRGLAELGSVRRSRRHAPDWSSRVLAALIELATGVPACGAPPEREGPGWVLPRMHAAGVGFWPTASHLGRED